MPLHKPQKMSAPIRWSLFLFFIAISGISLYLPAPPAPGAVGPFLNGVFPETPPGKDGTWELDEPFPNMTFYAPVRILPFPGTDDILILGKRGVIWRVSVEDQSRKTILDFRDRSFGKGDAGAVGIALHPQFGDPSAPEKQELYLFYRTKPEPQRWSELGFNRLSRFKWDPENECFDLNSEEVLIQQYDRSTWHNGGALFFDSEGFLYVSLGDEGPNEHQRTSTQSISGGFFSGILRIDVDNDPSRSHPIRRQPLPPANPPAGWGETFSQGYSIPNDNPWQSPEGEYLEEFFAIGARSPYAMSYDAETGQIWMADVGSRYSEEINLVEKGDNLQWPYLEGSIPIEEHEKPDNLIGNEKPVYFEYDRAFGACVIGGSVYRSTEFPELNGKYIFADYTSNRLMALTQQGSNAPPLLEILVSNLGSQPVDVPRGAGITGVFPLRDGQVFVTVIGDRQDEVPGKIFRLVRNAVVPDPPARLSELGVFTDLESLTPVEGVIPYRVNSPLWSDRAQKRRWIALPNDGSYDTPEEQITFRANEDWDFPEGTVFIKHFDLPVTTDPEGPTRKLETRFFVLGRDNRPYGLTYQWNDEGTEAFLLGGGLSRDLDIYEKGSLLYTQTWDFPSRGQCMSCHNAAANFVLGVKTHQLNGELEYPELGRKMNQLEYFNQIGVFQRDIGRKDRFLRAYAIEDESADLELRVRSYLDANCASCHRPGGVPNLTLDLRLNRPLALQNMVKAPTLSHASRPNQLIVRPGFHESSELWLRDASLDENRMPPIGRNLIDEPYIRALAEWIDNLAEDAGAYRQHTLFPNPSTGWLGIRISDDWQGPFQLTVRTISGQVIQQRSASSNSIHIDLTGQPPGIYLLEITAGQERHVERFVVQ